MPNIKQTDLLEYLVKEFNDNKFKIPFRMGTFEGNSQEGLTIYAPTRDNQGRFDEVDTFDEETYQIGKRAFVVMSGASNSGEYTALPNVQLINFDVDLEFLVYVDSPVSEIIRMAIEEVRDRLIGRLDKITVSELDIDNPSKTAPRIETVLKVVTTADGIDFGQIITIKKRNYMTLSLNVSMTVSKNVEFGNQIKWEISKLLTEELAVEPTVDISDYEENDIVTSSDTSLWKVVFNWVLREDIPIGQLEPCQENPPTEPPLSEDDIFCVSGVDAYEWKKVWEFHGFSTHDVIPLISSWGTTQDQESFQTLRPLNPTLAERAKEVHNYVKSKGFGTAFTLLLDTQQPIIKEMYKESFVKKEKPSVYQITKKTLVYDSDSDDFIYDEDLTFTRKMIYGEVQVADVVYGEPIVFGIGFTPSAKDV